VGLVPGGRYFHLGTQIYDRQTLKPVAAREFPHMDVTGMTFSGTGDRYAVVMWKSRDEDDHDWWRHRDANKESLVRVHETLNGNTLLALSPTHAARSMRFSSDGKRLAIACDDGTIEIRDLPAKRTK
jgi:WD40 repeat protein